MSIRQGFIISTELQLLYMFLYIWTYNYKNMKENTEIQVEMVETDKVKVLYHQVIANFGTLGKEIKVSPKANVCVNKPGYKLEMFVESVSITIGIGKDHCADIVMRKETWDALKSGEEVSVTTTKEFKERFL